MTDDLFTFLDEQKRHRLRSLGWYMVGGLLHGRPLWKTPDGRETLSEEEAFARLARIDSEEGDPS